MCDALPCKMEIKKNNNQITPSKNPKNPRNKHKYPRNSQHKLKKNLCTIKK